MKRECANCPWCAMIETAHGNIRYICADEDGGNFMGETGLCGWCDVPEGESDNGLSDL